jgi:hypothetical protein
MRADEHVSLGRVVQLAKGSRHRLGCEGTARDEVRRRIGQPGVVGNCACEVSRHALRKRFADFLGDLRVEAPSQYSASPLRRS